MECVFLRICMQVQNRLRMGLPAADHALHLYCGEERCRGGWPPACSYPCNSCPLRTCHGSRCWCWCRCCLACARGERERGREREGRGGRGEGGGKRERERERDWVFLCVRASVWHLCGRTQEYEWLVACMHEYMHALMNTCMHNMHAHVHTMHLRTHAHACACMHLHTHAHACNFAYTCACMHVIFVP